MAGITLEQAQAKLDMYINALDAIQESKSVTLSDGRNVTYHDLDAVNKSIQFWDNKVKTLSQQASGRGRARSVAPGW